MGKVTIFFGLLLILLGVFGYVGTGSHAPTALIPAYVGGVFCVLGFLANTDDAKKRMLFMHIAVTLGLIGFLGTVKSIYDYIRMQQGVQFPHPAAVTAKAAMSGILLFYVLLCVRSFINARRVRA
jgi:hypothetical protein